MKGRRRCAGESARPQGGPQPEGGQPRRRQAQQDTYMMINIHKQINTSLSISLSLSLYIYIYICVRVKNDGRASVMRRWLLETFGPDHLRSGQGVYYIYRYIDI